MEPPQIAAESESKPAVGNPLPLLACLLNALIAVLWFATSAFIASPFFVVCWSPGFFAILAAIACYRRASWWVALGLSVLAANALAVLLLLLARRDYEAATPSAPP